MLEERTHVLVPERTKYNTTPLIRTLVIRIGLALRVNLSRILQSYLALKLPVIESITVQCYGF